MLCCTPSTRLVNNIVHACSNRLFKACWTNRPWTCCRNSSKQPDIMPALCCQQPRTILFQQWLKQPDNDTVTCCFNRKKQLVIRPFFQDIFSFPPGWNMSPINGGTRQINMQLAEQVTCLFDAVWKEKSRQQKKMKLIIIYSRRYRG